MDIADLTRFLISAKKKTYAAEKDDAVVSPFIANSRQLEYSEGELLYRDIYVGSAFFIGQEIVSSSSVPIWSMVYSGGILTHMPELPTEKVYAFLKGALRNVDESHPFRGPSSYQKDHFVYTTTLDGDMHSFQGREVISVDGRKIYELHYSGGITR